ncbi:DUF4338 domain-containing protein [Desulfoferrobacter suflitae]|uniref:DUF4338 domain-containing protein n=1 Tax=Desulfoferrobacter suflitae TaxID=2865782 RepID=UPI00216493FB|nr:DUF4338 domain-containing protein [Desulfoferrobacter suflitae]MCK8603689.1 DUF4338 domain-containing protein [Desulfoferrobacter suflitae]
MIQCGRRISREEMEGICDTVEACGQLSRKELALTICEHLEWYSASGSPKLDACLKLLQKLEARGDLELPAKRTSVPGQLEEPRRSRRSNPQPPIKGEVGRIGGVRLELVRDRQAAGLWNEFVSRYHYLGYKKSFGCYLRYFVESEAGKLGCLLFSGAAKALRERDRWIGWSTTERLHRLGWVVNNTRFVIFPWVRVKNLASHVLGQAARRIEKDWQEQWNYRPVLLETFVDPRFYEGTCYRAANWRYLGMTTGDGLVRKGKCYTTRPKKIFVLPLCEDFRGVLCSLPDRTAA